MYTPYFLCFIIYLRLCSAAAEEQNSPGNQLQRLVLGSSLSAQNRKVLMSPGGTFSAGFYSVGDNAYAFAVWYTYTPNLTVVWMANRDEPVNGLNSLIRLQTDGDLVLYDVDGSDVWKSNTKTRPVNEAILLSNGNLVLRDSAGNNLWQSFDSPIDTLLPGQPFTKTTQLVSSMGLGTHKSGYYRFFFDDDNVLALVYDGFEVSSRYWPPPSLSKFEAGRSIYNSSRFAVLDEAGRFSSSDEFSLTAWDYGKGIHKRRLTLDFDGSLRLYSLDARNLSWTITGIVIAEQCRVDGLCGEYGLCMYAPEPRCVCPPGFQMADSTDRFKGCKPIKRIQDCGVSNVKLVYLPHTDYYGSDSSDYGTGKSFEECKKVCMDDCDCLGFAYVRGTGKCFPKLLLFNGRHSPGTDNLMFVKIAVEDSSVANVSSLMSSADSIKCSPRTNYSASPILPQSRKRSQLIPPLVSLVSAIGLVEIVCTALGWWYIYRHDDDALFNRRGYFAIPAGFKRFSFSDLKRATDNFKDVIGKGGFGTVYKGTLLPDNKMVAVKRLEGVSQAEEEFWAEVSVIGTVHHMNLVRMFGFCAERKHRLLVYEYVENGSLDSYLFSHNEERKKALDWKKRFQIAVGTAKGLAYLHEECLEWILHCDVKPQNILLDEQFRPKVSDFGLSKLVDRHRERALSFSTIRGTRGYMAPEWTMNLAITAKVDVYSFGILLLELASGQNAAEFNVSDGNLVQWAAENVRRQRWMDNLVDRNLQAAENGDTEWKSDVERVLKTALLCVEFDRNRRPSMSQAVEMLTTESAETTDVFTQKMAAPATSTDEEGASSASKLSHRYEPNDINDESEGSNS